MVGQVSVAYIARNACVLYRIQALLYALAHKRQEDLISPPTPEVDEFWHQHILDTRRYREDCERVFGRYVDHTPGLEPEEQAKADARRRRVYTERDIDFMSFDGGDGASSDNSIGTGDGGESHHHDASHPGDGGHHTSGHDASGHDGGGQGGDSGGHGGDSGGSGDGGGGCGGGCGGG